MNFALGFATAFGAGLVLAWLWRRMGAGDESAGEEASRKLQAVAVPAVGGLALLLSWHLGWWRDASSLADSIGMVPGDFDHVLTCGTNPRPRLSPMGRVQGFVLAAFVAFFVGWIDDVRRDGLSPKAKAAGQMLAGACLVIPGAQGWLWSIAILAPTVIASALGALIACNALNTFDNADGAAAGVGGVGLLAAASPLAPAVLGFAALQLLVRRGPKRDAVAYLGDSGSHLLGIVVLAVPATWPLLALPLLDLIRVAQERLSAGQPPWRGDRRHLAHRLQRRGLGNWAVVALLIAISAPVVFWPGVFGLLATTGLFLIAVRLTRELLPPAPCPEPVASR